jgi:hypothetical protein
MLHKHLKLTSLSKQTVLQHRTSTLSLEEGETTKAMRRALNQAIETVI